MALHGFEHLSKDGEGYVYWKGTHVEHYSFGHSDDSAAREREAAAELAQRCEHLEALGVRVTCGTAVWTWPWYEGIKDREQLDNLDPLLRSLLLNPKDLYEDSLGRFAWIAESQKLNIAPDCSDSDSWRSVARVCVVDRGEHSSFHLKSDDLGGFYHPLKALGWNIAQMGQNKDNGCCYATTEQLLTWFAVKMGRAV